MFISVGGNVTRSTVHRIQELAVFSDSIGRGSISVTEHYQGVLIEWLLSLMGRHCLTVLLPITKRKHLYPQYLDGASWASSQASFSRPRIIPYRDQNPEPNAFQCNYFVDVSSAGVKVSADHYYLSVASHRQACVLGMASLPFLWSFPLVYAPRMVVRCLINQVEDLQPGSHVPKSVAKPQRSFIRHTSLRNVPGR